MIKQFFDYKFGVEYFLGILTIIKIVIVYLFFQNIVIYIDSIPRISEAFAWGELIENMHNGEYFNTSQYSLAHLYDLKFHALRPPVYSGFLYLITFCGNFAGLIAVIIQSIATSFIAYLSYRIIKLSSKSSYIPALFMVIIFLLPFNLLKSGSVDDAVFMLLFILGGIFFLIRGISKTGFNLYYILTGFFFGLALLTRPAAIFPLSGMCLFMLIRYWRKYKELLLVLFVSVVMVSPWIIRNNSVLGSPVYTSGGGRILLLMQSEEFINNFPEKSIDLIERNYFTENYNQYRYINQLSELEKDSEFVKLAINQAYENPLNMLRSVLIKLKVFLPIKYYPTRGDWLKSLVFIASYWIALFLFISGLIIMFKKKIKLLNASLLIVSVISYSMIGVLMFMSSRHFYPLIVFMILFSGIIFSRTKSIIND